MRLVALLVPALIMLGPAPFSAARAQAPAAQADASALEVRIDKVQLLKLGDGKNALMFEGNITNCGPQKITMPPIKIVLRNSRNAVVYAVELPPPVADLEPGRSAPINHAIMPVPQSASHVEIGLAWPVPASPPERP